MNDLNTPLSRRDFIKNASAAGAGFMVLPSFVAGQSNSSKAPNSRINIAIVGVGGKGRGPTIDCLEENVVALCDVDMGKVASDRQPTGWNPQQGTLFSEAITEHEKRGAKWYKDYRVMFEEMADKIDAVIISTPDHMHFPIALSALNLGMHVYCEKPLTHTVDEARILTEVAAKKGVVTQMGNQGHSNEGTRLVKEWIEGGVLGEVREVHSWTSRPIGSWKDIHGMDKPDHSEFIPVVPEGLDWDLWQGVAERRAYDPHYLPFSWRGYLDYGCGSLGDMACHIMNSSNWALNLGQPTEISALTSHRSGYTYPYSSVVTYEFPQRGKMPPVTYKWYDGDLLPSLPHFLKDYNPYDGNEGENGTLIIGEGIALHCSSDSSIVRIVPDEKFREVRTSLPPKTLRRVKGTHLDEWLNAIREDRPANGDFSYSGPFTEMVLLGCVAQQTGRHMEYDAAKRSFKNDIETTALLKKDYPDGWVVG